MRIVIDARESGTTTGRYVDKLVEYLHRLQPEHEIVILTKPARLKFFKDIAPSFKTVRSDVKEFTFAEQLALKRQIKKLRPDLVHFPAVQQPIFYRGKVVTAILDLTTIRFRNPAKNSLIFNAKQVVYKWLVKKAAKKSAHLLTISEYVNKDIAEYCGVSPNKITVAYPAADRISEPPESLPNLAGKQFIMYVGRALPHKNLPRLVEAFALLTQKYPDLYLVLAGKNDANYKKVGELVTEKRLAHSVIFTGRVSDGELRWLYENTAAYVFPSLSEGFGLPGLEAMVHGAPVVSSNATCLPEIYGDAAHYFDPFKPVDIATKIHEVISHPRLRARLITSGKERAAKYSWRRMAQQTLGVYNDALSKGP